MLNHLHPAPVLPSRVVIMGAAGFVGGALFRRLAPEGVPVLALGRSDVDLLAENAGERLGELLRPDDVFVAVSARAPCKSVDMLLENIRIAQAIASALAKQPVAHLLNIGSDAVYADQTHPLTESSCASPGSLHGVMHLAREVILKSDADARGVPFASLRPTLIYGAEDPHNGYGPNRFRRLAAAGDPIVLFGEGEERRDHVLVDDVADLAWRMIAHRSVGILNAATGCVASFREIAEHVVALAARPVEIKGSPRQGPMPHNGYRPFDPAATRAAFPDFTYTPLTEGLAKAQREMAERG